MLDPPNALVIKRFGIFRFRGHLDCCCALLRLQYKSVHFLLLKLIVRPKYGKAVVVSSGSNLTHIDSRFASKQRCRASR